jgi:holo-ACP synthase/triphosphoribosyl-dephospho-CoA synthase
MTALEECHPLGRLFDIDVIAEDGDKVSRSTIGLPERACLVCGKTGAGCARSRAHPLDEVERRTLFIIENYLQRKDAQFIAQNALRALLYEVSTTPKPGLVDRWDSGAHSDMDFFTYIDGSTALAAYFYDMAAAGITSRNILPGTLLTRLRFRGVIAEEEMYAATGGVNTHKGLIFSLGLVCVALGYHGFPFPGADAVLQTAAQIATPALHNDLEGVTPQNAVTHGEAVFAKYGASGIRGEAAAAFPSVRFWGIPVIQKALSNGKSYNDAGVETLLYLLAHVTDTNVINRSNHEVLKTLQTSLQTFLDTQPDNTAVLKYAEQLNTQFIIDNISPGGCADLLAISFMLYFMAN